MARFVHVSTLNSEHGGFRYVLASVSESGPIFRRLKEILKKKKFSSKTSKQKLCIKKHIACISEHCTSFGTETKLATFEGRVGGGEEVCRTLRSRPPAVGAYNCEAPCVRMHTIQQYNKTLLRH